MHSVDEVKTWLKAMGERGVYGGASARIRATAIERLATVLAKDEPRDAKWLLEHMDDVARRWATKNQANPTTTETYRSRAKATLRDYLEYQKDPAKFRPAGGGSPKNPVNGRPKKKAEQSGGARGSTNETEAAERMLGSTEMVSLPATDANSQSFSFVLTGSRRAHLVVPSDLTTTDIKILRKQIELLELQVDCGSSKGGRD